MARKSLLSDEKRMELMNIYRDNPAAAARDLLGVDLAPHQRVMLKSMWDCNNVITILSRGSVKTFIDAVFAVLRAMLYPGEKVGIFGPSYRQCLQLGGNNIFTNNGMINTSDIFRGDI